MTRTSAFGTPSRRAVLAGAAASAGLASVKPAWAQGDQPSLRDLAAARGLLFGSVAGMAPPGRLGGSLQDPAYQALLIADCGGLVAENEMKWAALRPDAERFDFDRMDQIAAFATEHDMALRGHTLLWHHPQWFPRWLTDYDYGARPAAEGERLLTEHIRGVTARYPQVVSFDVVNETVDAGTGALRETSLSRAMGQEVLDVAFHTAREAAPQARLCYNDYMSWEAGHEAHRAGVLRLLEGFRKRGVPVDALGVQSHIGSGNTDDSVGFDTAQEREWRVFLDEVVGMGFDLEITEFDVHDKNLPLDFEVRDRAVADLAERYLDLMLDYPQTRTVMLWGLADHYSWLQGLWPRADGAAKRPTPWDAAFKPKPLRAAIERSLTRAKPR
ncbi:glycosyl hydrolase [Brevundimonas sp. LM2]|uniref:endo-1,4-beta-xylanase n=1 Tax=Brevundimonas sp. LM2 TaxID=1938605 RepID=UPI000983B495|nr:endo-1,4-beta-xylanase [Brevundimonas sp. LM2]AQR61303.1 glycosyl hydrolase [Brevundimonas sp. LM2]